MCIRDRPSDYLVLAAVDNAAGNKGGTLGHQAGHGGRKAEDGEMCIRDSSLRVPFSAVAQPLLADGRFVQPHRSYVVNLEAVSYTHLDVYKRQGW